MRRWIAATIAVLSVGFVSRSVIASAPDAADVPRYRLAVGDELIYEGDDHFDFTRPRNNMLAAVRAYASWGFFDYRLAGEKFDDGYQSVPVNWTISSPRKREFFALLSKVTGVGSP